MNYVGIFSVYVYVYTFGRVKASCFKLSMFLAQGACFAAEMNTTITTGISW